jgi:hypothetical protein
MAAGIVRYGCRGDSFVQQQVARIHGVIVEAGDQVPGLDARRFHRTLRVVSELHYIQNQLQQRLILVISAGRRERKQRLAIL